MKVLCAGSGGFISGHLIGRLLRDGHDVRAVDIKAPEDWYQIHPHAENWVADLSEQTECNRAVDGCDTVINLAADMGGMGFIQTQQVATGLNVLISTYLILAACRAGASRYLYSSSACIYPEFRQDTTAGVQLKESDAWPAQPQDLYGVEKIFSEQMALSFYREHDLEVRLPRYHAIYGPEGTWDGGREKAPAAICRKVAEAKLSGRHEIEIWGDGNQTRSFCYIDDCVDGTLRLLDSDVREPLNIGSSELVSINELVSIVEDIAGVTLARRYLPGAPQGVRGRNSDNTKIKELLGWEPSISLRAGLEQTYAWVEEQVESHALVPA